ncbi:MAG: hypothetical protein V4757_04710 [Pseudomonadota bacterium]
MPNGHGFSFPYGLPLVLYPVLALALPVGSGKWWGWVLILVCALLAFAFAREGLSKSSFGKVHEKDPSLNRLTWLVNWLLFFALPPAVLAGFGVVKMLLG